MTCGDRVFITFFWGVERGDVEKWFWFHPSHFFEWCDFIRTWNIGKSRQTPQKPCFEQGVGWLNGSDSPLDACLELRSWVAKDDFGFSISQVGEFRIEGSGAACFPWNFGTPKRLGLIPFVDVNGHSHVLINLREREPTKTHQKKNSLQNPCSFLFSQGISVDGRNPKQPPTIIKTLEIMETHTFTSTGEFRISSTYTVLQCKVHLGYFPFLWPPTWRIIPVSNWLVRPIYKPWSSPMWKGSHNPIPRLTYDHHGY